MELINLPIENTKDIVLAHDDVLCSVHFSVAAGVLSKQDAIAGFNVQRDQLAIFQSLAVPDSEHLTLLRLLFGGIGNYDSVACGLGFVDPLHYKAVV